MQYSIESFSVFTGIMSATGNGYVMYMTAKRKTKLKPPEIMTLNLAIFDFGISGEFALVHVIIYQMRENKLTFLKQSYSCTSAITYY